MASDRPAPPSAHGLRADSSLEGFCREHYRSVLGLLVLHVGNREVAEDLAMDVFSVVCERWATIAEMDHPVAYVKTMALNRSRSWFRRRLASMRASVRQGPVDLAHDDADVALREMVRAALKTLPERDRRVLVLRYYGGLSTDEIARAMGCPSGTVRSRLSRATAVLRDQLDIADETKAIAAQPRKEDE